MIQLLIDISMIMTGTRFTGIPRVVMEISRQLSGKKDIELHFLEFQQKKDCFEEIDTAAFLQFCKNRSGNRARMRTGRYIDYTKIKKDLKQEGVHTDGQDTEDRIIFLDLDTVWKSRVRRSFLYPLLREQNIQIISHVYDIIPVTHPQFCILDDAICFLDYISAVVQYSDQIIVNSHATAHSLEKMCRDIQLPALTETVQKIRIIPLGGNFAKKDRVQETNIRPQIRQIAKCGKYLLQVGTIEPRKNHKMILDAYDAGLKEKEFSVVIVGFPGWNVDDLLTRIKEHPDYQNGIYYPENVNDDELQYLYKHCFALMFPSFIEGYGLPIMEAMVKGVPVIASDTEINVETGGECAAYYKKESIQSLIETVDRLENDQKLLSGMREKMRHFVPPTWEESGNQFYDLLTGDI